jgi:RNA polymerase sigma factor (sigma-70 family)
MGANHPGAEQATVFDDGSVIEALRRGDEGAFARLVEHYHASLSRVARLYISNHAVADEVVQDTWLGVIRGIWAFEGRSSLKTWIFRILINRAKTRAAREGRTVPFARFEAEVEVEAAESTVASDRFQPAPTIRPSLGTGYNLRPTSEPPRSAGSWAGRHESSSGAPSRGCRSASGWC